MTTTKTIGRDLPDGDYIEIEAEERDGSGTLSPGFAITLTGWESSGTWSARTCARMKREPVYCGADHDTILRAAPELAPLVRAHLADPSGVPMHAVANGWYFYSGSHVEYERRTYGEDYATRHGTPHERAARSLHINPADLPTDLDEQGFKDFCRSLEGRWAEQAREARECLAAMVDGDGVEDR